jgi:uncharacterized Zn finger protein (UPF0148 family)
MGTIIMESCVLCREDFAKSSLKDIKGRMFCPECFETVNAKLRERKSSTKEKSAAVSKAAPSASSHSEQEPAGRIIGGDSAMTTTVGGSWSRTRPSHKIEKPALVRAGSRTGMSAEPTPAPLSPARESGSAPNRAQLHRIDSQKETPPPPSSPPPPDDDEAVQCAMCKNNFGVSTCVSVKGRYFCGPCHSKFMAQVEARKKQLAGKA